MCKKAFKWLKEKNMWKGKYEKQKVKATLYREEHDIGMDYLIKVAQQEASETVNASTTRVRRSKRNKQA